MQFRMPGTRYIYTAADEPLTMCCYFERKRGSPGTHLQVLISPMAFLACSSVGYSCGNVLCE